MTKPDTQPAAPRFDGKIPVLQILRALAALAVGQSHVISAAIAHHTVAFQIDFRYLENFGACGVDLFFAISGFIVPLTAMRPGETAPRFLLRRVIRIYPLWWIAVLLTFGIRLAMGSATGPWLASIPWSLTLLPSADPAFVPAVYLGWSLIFEMLFYALIIVVWGTSPRWRLWRILALLAVMGGSGVVFGTRFPLGHILANPMLLQFALGVAMGIWWLNRSRIPRWAAPLTLAAGAGGLFATAFFGFGEIYEMRFILDATQSAARFLLWGFPSAIVVFGCLLWAPVCQSRAARLFVALGDASYSIYLTSVFTQSLLFKTWGFISWMPGDLAILAGTALMAVVGYITFRLVEEPLLRQGREWMRRKPEESAPAHYPLVARSAP